MRLGLIMLGCLWLAYTATAGATTTENQAALHKYFAAKGEIQIETYPPISGPEIGVAVLAPKPAAEGATPGTSQLVVARVAGRGNPQEVLAEALPAANGNPQFALMMNGKHLMTYGTSAWTDPAGISRARGDLRIRDLEAEGGVKVIYELKDVVDLSLPVGSVQYSDCLLWQPWPHFLNARGVLPVRNSYVQLSYNTEKKEYRLYQHLSVLPDADTIEAANMNNRAILFYRLGDLGQASELLEQAYASSEADQSLIAHNQELIKGELSELGRQSTRIEGRPSDRALMYFWQGDYAGCLRELAPRQHDGLSDPDCAMAGLAMASQKRWPEVDKLTINLEHHKAPFLAEYIGRLVHIADLQGYGDVASLYLQALAAADAASPAYAALNAEALDRKGKTADAERALEQYLLSHPGGSVNAEPRLKLYELYARRGNSTGCEQLQKDALQGPVTDLLGYVLLADYMDLSSALKPMKKDADHIQAPPPLETFGIN